MPFYHYDHLDGWAEARLHDPERIVLLCAKHHDEKTRGMLPASAVEEAAKFPLNLKQGHSAGHPLHFRGERVEVEVGTNRFTADLSQQGAVVPISVDGTPLVEFRREDDRLLLSASTFDWFNVQTLVIEDNELAVTSTPWDVSWEGRRLRVRLSENFLLIDLEFRPPNALVISEGRFLCNGVWIQITPAGVRVANVETLIAHNHIGGRMAGIVIGEMPEGVSTAAFHIGQVFRYSRDMAISVGVALNADGSLSAG